MYKLQVTADKLNIRNTPDADPTFANWVGDMNKGEEFNAIRLVKGTMYNGSDDWYTDENNRYVTAKELQSTEGYQQWMIDLRLPEIWQSTTGKDVGVAVIDTGIVLNNAEMPFNQKIFGTYKNSNDINDLKDTAGHGTECSSIIGARNKNGNIIGVAPDCNLFSYKISEVEHPTDSPQSQGLIMADAIDWCCQQKEIKVISISWAILGLLSDDPEDKKVINKIEQALANAYDEKIIVVTSRGNLYSTLPDSSCTYPACSDNVLSVGILPTNNQINYTGFIDITTNANNIAVYSLQTKTTDSGTSMATAIIAGVIALIIQKKGMQNDLDDIKQILKKLSKNNLTDKNIHLEGDLLNNYLTN